MNVKKSVRAVVYLILISAISYVSMVSGAPPDRPDFLQNLPPWELHEAPPQVNYTKPPVHFLIDENGTAFRKKVVVDDTGAYKVTEELVASKVLKAIRKLRHVALIDKQIANQNDAPPPDPSELAATCPLSSSFSIMFNADGEAYGNEGFDYTSKPAEANTQWLTFDFYTEDYRGKARQVTSQ